MKHFTKIILIMAAMLMSNMSFAGIDTDDLGDFNKLSPTQKAEIVAQIAKASEQNTKYGINKIPDTPEQLQKWAEVGSAVGKGLVATARELGVEVNEFAKTGVGKLAIVLLVWNVLGSDIIHIVGGIMWFLIALPMWMYYFRKLCVVKSIEYNEKGKKSKVVYFGKGEVEEARITMTIAIVIIIAIGMVITFSY